jgi:DNA polymerase
MRRKPTDPIRQQLEQLRELGFAFLEEYREAEPAVAAGEREAAPPPVRELNTGVVAWEGVPDLAVPDRVEALARIASEIAVCEGCRLCHGRTNTVPGEGNPMAELAFVGEGPGQNEDEQGRPFVGEGGKLLTKIIEAMQFKREEVFIANVVKCRPPGNRTPEADEMQTCLPFLQRQLAIVRPRVIVTLGKTALAGLRPDLAGQGITRLRGAWLEFSGVPLMPTFHPAYLLRSPQQKRLVWEDMQKVMARFGKDPGQSKPRRD